MAGLNNDGTERRVGPSGEAGGRGGMVGGGGLGRVVTKAERDMAGLPQKPTFEGVDNGSRRS